jgi:glycosyltransferase involved in cell wall biosynthesis
VQPSNAESKPRLLVVTSMFPRWRDDSEPGFVYELCRRMTDSFDIRVIAPHARGAARREVIEGVDVFRYRYAPLALQTLAYEGGIVPKLRRHRWKWLLVPFFLIAQYFAVRSMLRRWHPDLIHAHWIIPQGLVTIAATNSRIPVIVTSHGGDLFGLRGKWLARLKAAILRRSSKVTVVSSVMKDIVVEMGIAPEKVVVAPMGVDLTQRFVVDESVRRNNNEILFVGRLAEKKGVRFLLDAAPRIFAEFPDAFITIAGFGPEEALLRAQAERLQVGMKVHFIGAVPSSKVVDLYRHAAVFVAPFVEDESGDQEGLGLVVVEAIGCGCPVVVSKIPATRDIFGNDLSWYVAPKSVDQLFEAAARILLDVDLASAQMTSLRGSVEQRFDWSHVTAKYSALIAEGISAS